MIDINNYIVEKLKINKDSKTNNFDEINNKFISDIKADIGKPKMEYKSFEVDHDIYEEIEANFEERMYNDVQALEKEVRDKNMEKLSEDVTNYFIEKYGEERA